ncbi:MAG TPA: ABC transporter ATP-binding protein/permease, partial [Azospirillaceae bacterium]|nr:ABC transporter ATP-binding protein/permease [Azospirillaceae bacterium]
MLQQTRRFLSDIWTLAKPYWNSEERWAARLLLAAIIVLNLGLVGINVMLNQWNNAFYNALQDKDWEAFLSQLMYFCVLATVFIVVAVYRIYLNQMLQIRWRRWLTNRYIDEWLGGQTYYRLQFADNPTDNPDQRIADDLRMFVSLTLSLSLDLLSSVVTLVSFLGILWSLSGPVTLPVFGGIEIPGYMLWVAIVYAILGTWLTHKVGRPLTRLNFDQQRYEADFRFSLVRFRENAEAIALQGGEADEARAFGRRFGDVMSNWWDIMRRQKQLTWLTAGYSQVAMIFPIVVIAPRYFAGAIQLGGLMQTASAFRQVQESLSWFVDSYVNLTEWRATVDRLIGFHNAIVVTQAASAAKPTIARGQGDTPALSVEGLVLALPRQDHGFVEADLKVERGDWVLMTGPSGSGKSTLFRAIAGIWPFG